MEVWEMNPYIRYMDQRKCSLSYTETVFAYDYRLFAVCSGRCEIEIADKSIKLLPDSVVIIPPCTGYRMKYDVQSPSVLYDINFTLRYLPGRAMAPDNAGTFHAEAVPEQPDHHLFMPYTVIHGSEGICRNTAELLRLYEEQNDFYEERCSAALKGILIDCLCAVKKNYIKNDLAVKIARFLEEHCRETMDAKAIGTVFGYHPFYLNRVFRERYGTTMHRYQTVCRIRRASSMLVNTRLTIREIADSLGFSPGPYFSEVFRAVTGMTPTQYRRLSASYSVQTPPKE